ncbi:hypothetical protein BS50DRAFT_350543 [Corynespora cassiicola Philippines]|uniref:Uncharacterized protein n=1 Tax=Corynespora cassiicola Philippines TaxID=1448308 RepID=A0A2T2NQZ9_CORCC|nr:hypothetical protein BS50DRAFT_350543 [Corynespora cassiicola Philippines]
MEIWKTGESNVQSFLHQRLAHPKRLQHDKNDIDQSIWYQRTTSLYATRILHIRPFIAAPVPPALRPHPRIFEIPRDIGQIRLLERHGRSTQPRFPLCPLPLSALTPKRRNKADEQTHGQHGQDRTLQHQPPISLHPPNNPLNPVNQHLEPHPRGHVSLAKKAFAGVEGDWSRDSQGPRGLSTLGRVGRRGRLDPSILPPFFIYREAHPGVSSLGRLPGGMYRKRGGGGGGGCCCCRRVAPNSREVGDCVQVCG